MVTHLVDAACADRGYCNETNRQLTQIEVVHHERHQHVIKQLQADVVVAFVKHAIAVGADDVFVDQRLVISALVSNRYRNLPQAQPS